MEKDGIKVLYYEGEYWETLVAAGERYGVTAERLSEGFKKNELFWGKNPRNGVNMVCGALPKEERAEGSADDNSMGLLGMLVNVIICPRNEIQWTLMWMVFWITVGVLVGTGVNAMLGVSLVVLAGCVKLVLSIKWAIEHPQEDKSVLSDLGDCFGAGDDYYYGGGFFDEVSDRRREDLKFLLGNY